MKAIKVKTKFVEKIEDVKLPNGKVVKIQKAEHNGSVVIIAFKNKKIIIEKEFRPVIKKWIYELPAGTIEKGETPEECARRELVEEIGYFPKKLKKIFSSYTSPGYSTELQHFFVATELKKVDRRPESYELIKFKELSIEEALRMIKNKKIIDGKTIQALLFFKFFREKK